MDEKEILRRLKEEGEQIEIPEELRPERVEKMLESVKELQETWAGDEMKEKHSSGQKNRKWYRYTKRIAAAAVVLLCIGGAYGTSQMMNSGNKSWKSDSAAESVQKAENGSPAEDAAEQAEEDEAAFPNISVAKVGDMYTRAADYEEIYDKLDEDREKWDEIFWNGFDTAKGESDGASTGDEKYMAESAAEVGTAPVEAGSDYSITNLMTAGVDESDIVKTDGKYIYLLRDDRVTITDIRNGALKEAAAFRPPMNSASGRVLEMYVDKEQLIVITQEEKTEMSSYGSDSSAEEIYAFSDVYRMDSESCTTAYIYDISNPAKPKLENTVEQDGGYHTSRKIGSILYLFTDYVLDLPDGRKRDAITEEGAKDWIPSVNDETVPADCIYLPESGRNSLLISSADVTKQGKMIDTKMIVSNYVDIYVSSSSIFLYETDYASNQTYTRIAKFALEDGLIQGVDAASVRGAVQDAFAVNEYQGYLRVLTTDWQNGSDINEIYVLDSDMKLTGEVSGIAPGERIYSARFLKDTGYFVTYRNTDPLFTADFSDPANPRITGELKVTGFSEYLHFWGADKLLGIGYETDPDTGNRIGIKLSMFDISDPSNVSEESKLVLKGADYSPALYDYKCVLADKEKNLIGFAVEAYGMSWDKASYQVYSYEDGGFVRKLEQDLEDYYDLYEYRGLYAGTRFYLAGGQEIQAYDMENEFKKEEEATGMSRNTDDLPVYESTSVYPEFTLSSLTDTASYILKAEVVEVGDSFLKEISASLTENPAEAAESLGYPVTPVTLKVDNAVKGYVIDDEFTYYEEGGITSAYIQLPDGYAVEEGMEIILFLNQNGYGWGAQSIFPIIEDKVVLNETAWDYFDEKHMSVLDTQDLNFDDRSQINMEKVCLVPVDDFIGVIQELLLTGRENV